MASAAAEYLDVGHGRRLKVEPLALESDGKTRAVHDGIGTAVVSCMQEFVLVAEVDPAASWISANCF